MATEIDFSAQFGGRDAAQAVLPHFRALKAAAQGRLLTGFPRKKLAFILRVDGEVNSYGLSGAGNVEFDKSGEYVSVDIGITRDDLSNSGADTLSAFIDTAIMSSIALLQNPSDPRLAGTDIKALESVLRDLCLAYKVRLTAAAGT